MTSITSAVARRGAPALHQFANHNWQRVVEQFGAFYMGSSSAEFAGTQQVRPWRQKQVLAVSSDGEARVYSNHCVHAGKQLLSVNHDLNFHREQTIRCPWHWVTYAPSNGEIIRTGAMHINKKELSEKACRQSATHEWQELIFDLGTKDVESKRSHLAASLKFVEEVAPHLFNFSQYRLRETKTEVQRADVVTSLVNYLDIRHVPSHATTLGPLVNMREYVSHKSPDNSCVVQLMGGKQQWVQSDSPYARELRHCGIAVGKWAAAWVTFDFGLMLEYYPGVIVVSQCFPNKDNPWQCTFYHDFFYHESASPELIDIHQALFKETGDEDEAWCADAAFLMQERIAEGREDEPWGFIDPECENFARWFYERVQLMQTRLTS